jgi:hypothetical protein
MEKLIEKVEVITADGRKAVFEIIDTEKGRRAYLVGSSLYYDMDVFERGLEKASDVKRISCN